MSRTRAYLSAKLHFRVNSFKIFLLNIFTLFTLQKYFANYCFKFLLNIAVVPKDSLKKFLRKILVGKQCVLWENNGNEKNG